MIRDVSDVVRDADTAATKNTKAIANLEEMWEEKTIGTTKLLEPSSNDVSGILLRNTIIKGTDLSGITIGDADNMARTEYAMALGIGADASGTGHFMYKDSCNNTFVFDSSGDGCVKINDLCIGGSIPGVKCGYPGDEDIVVKGTAEASGMILAPIQSAEGTSQSAIVCLDPSENPLMSGGMYWLNEAHDGGSGWVWGPSMIVQRCHGAAAALGGKLYVVGGGGLFDDDTSYPWLDARSQVYNPIANSWDFFATPLCAPEDKLIWTDGNSLTALGGKLYLVGGSTYPAAAFPNGFPPAGARASGQVYDPATNRWSAIAPMNTARCRFGMAALGGKLYVVGGGEQSEARHSFASAEVYDPIANSWSYIASMNTARVSCECASLGGKLYVAAGLPRISSIVDGTNVGPAIAIESVEVYDPIANSWSYIANLNARSLPPSIVDAGSGRYGFWMTALGGCLYVGGGLGPKSQGQYNYFWQVEVYNPADPGGGWKYGMPTGTATPPNYIDASGTYGASAVALGGKLYVVGGNGSDVPNTTYNDGLYVYDPSLVQMPQITHQGEDFYVSAQRGGPKTFVIPHPEYEGKMLRHACLEAPTRGTNVYEYQFEATEDNQTTTIPLPSYFKHINGRVRVYVSAGKGKEWSWKRGKVNEELTEAIIKTEKTGTFNVMVTGVRKDPEAVAYSATENIDDPIDAKDI